MTGMQESYKGQQVMGWVMSRVTGWVTEYDEWVMRGEMSGDKVRGADTAHGLMGTACMRRGT